VKRPPQIDIKAGEDITYAMVTKHLAAFRWRVAEYWYVAAPGKAPRQFTSEQDSVKYFMELAMGATS
jgi:hypothetical protein